MSTLKFGLSSGAVLQRCDPVELPAGDLGGELRSALHLGGVGIAQIGVDVGSAYGRSTPSNRLTTSILPDSTAYSARSPPSWTAYSPGPSGCRRKCERADRNRCQRGLQTMAMRRRRR